MKHLFILALLLPLLCVSYMAKSGIIYVRLGNAGGGTSWSDAKGELQDALTSANTGDTIWVQQGIYFPSNVGDRTVSFNMKKGVAIYGGFVGTETTLSQRADSTGSNTLLSGNLGPLSNSSRIIYSSSDVDSNTRLDGFTITGAVLNLTTATAMAGAGIYNEGSPVLNNLVIRNNTTNVTTSDYFNTAFGGSGMCSMQGKPRLSNITFKNDSLRIISGGNGTVGGAGLMVGGGSAALSNVVLVNNFITSPNNIVQTGCALFVSSATVTVTNALIYKNVTIPTNAGNGSAVSEEFGTLTLTNVTFGQNFSLYSIYTFYSLNKTLIQNCILLSKFYNNFNNNVIINNSVLADGFNGTGVSYPYYTGSNNITYVPVPASLFQDTAHNDYSPPLCSLLIDAGIDSVNKLTTDLAGNPRKLHTIDIGAYEYPHADTLPERLYVNAASTVAYPDGISWATAFPDLQMALRLNCNNNYAKEIWVAAGTYVPTHDTDRTINFALKSGMNVYGGFSGNETSLEQRDSSGLTNVTILSGDIQNDSNNTNNSFNVVYVNADKTTQLNSFTITGGYGLAPGLQILNYTAGGGILCGRSDATFANLHIIHNVSGFYGGGFTNFDGSPRVINVVFENDTSGVTGGAVYNEGQGVYTQPGIQTFSATRSPVFINDTFINNYCYGDGGGMGNYMCSGILKNILFKDNGASNGGGMYANDSVIELSNTSFINNQVYNQAAGGKGGGLVYYAIYSYATLDNVLFANNKSGAGAAIDVYLKSLQNTMSLNNVTFCNNTDQFASDQYGTGNAICIEQGSDAAIKITNSIIDSVGNGIASIGGNAQYVTIANTLFGGSMPANIIDSGGNLIITNPLFADTAVQNYQLQTCSPAINAGNNKFLDPGIPTDLAGNARIFGNGIVDMGAYEYQATRQPLPTQPNISAQGPTAFCQGDSVQLSTTPGVGLTYQWLRNNVAISGGNAASVVIKTAGVINLKVSDVDNCKASSVADTVVIYPLPQPVLSVSGNVLSTTMPFYTYQWYENGTLINGATNTSYVYATNGRYNVSVTDSNGCNNMSNVDTVTDIGVGVSNVFAQPGIKVYPNPTTSVIYTNANAGTNIIISDLEGKQLLLASSVVSVDVSGLVSGTYLVRITDAAGRLLKIEKLVKLDH